MNGSQKQSSAYARRFLVPASILAICCIGALLVACSPIDPIEEEQQLSSDELAIATSRTRRDAGLNISKAHSNHIARRILERACKASKDTLQEVLNCMTNNDKLDQSHGHKCFKETFHVEFDPQQPLKHKELVCNNKEKIEEMTACFYAETAQMSPGHAEKLAETLVEVGMCVINALDG